MIYFQSSCSTQKGLEAHDSEIRMLNVVNVFWTKKEWTWPPTARSRKNLGGKNKVSLFYSSQYAIKREHFDPEIAGVHIYIAYRENMAF